MQPRRFHGGLRLPEHKSESTMRGIVRCALPARLFVPLGQHAGEPALACVVLGQRVRRGERIGQAQADRSAHVHAPARGVVVAVAANAVTIDVYAMAAVADTAATNVHPVPTDIDTVTTRLHAAPTDIDAATIDACVAVTGTDAAMTAHPAEDSECRLPPLDWQSCEPAQIVARIAEAGIAGLGGAAFPTAEKLAHPCRVLILNGAECEPWIACDDALLRESAYEVVQGGRVLQRAVGAPRVLLAIEDRMTQALAAARAALEGSDDIEIVAVPTIYPQGGERQLIEALTGEQVPAGGLPRDLGVIVHNVGTAAAAWRAVAHGEALVSRIVCVTGPGVASPGNYEVAFGTPIAHLVAQASGYTANAARLLLGGPMMGVALPDDAVPIDQRSNCVLVLGAGEVRRSAPTLPCIRCGDCAQACPANLLPQQLHLFLRAGDEARALEHGLMACIECGCCDLVCPSQLPLAEQFRLGKHAARERARAVAAANAARGRFEARNARLARVAQERAQREAERKPSASSAVQAALERAKARRREEE